jgi:hypothetical protein
VFNASFAYFLKLSIAPGMKIELQKRFVCLAYLWKFADDLQRN